MREPRWAVFISGRGSNAEALWELLADLNVVVCVSSRRKAYGVKRAQKLGIETLILDSKGEAKSVWSALSRELKARRVNRIFLLGFMKIIPEQFVQDWSGRMWNLHPSLLPEFPGLNAIENSFEANAPMGVTVHEVTAEMDAGPIGFQKRISVQPQEEMDLPEAQMRISQTEQRLVREWALRMNKGVETWK